VRAAAHQQALTAVVRAIAAEGSPACLLDTRATFLFGHEAWDQRALARGEGDGGSSLVGTSWLDRFACEAVRQRHADLLARALAPLGRAQLQVSERNTASTAELVSTRFEPVAPPGAAPLALKVVECTVRVRPVEEVYDVAHRPLDAYRATGGAPVQCPCCQRLRDPAEPERWDLVPELLDAAAAHLALCPLCAEPHYGDLPRIG
jgi:hypothetical protein